jgi:hypothetical protein
MEREEQIYLKLFHMLNHISKRLSPQRDETRLNRAPERGEWSVREILIHLRDHEAQIYPKLHLMANATHPDLSRIGAIRNADYRPDDSTLMVLSQFRRIRISTVSLLRELPRDAWDRTGVDTDGTTVTIRQLAMELIRHDAEHLAQIDKTLLARDAMPFNVEPVAAG